MMVQSFFANSCTSGMKLTEFLSGWWLGMRNESHTTILYKSDRGQIRTNSQENSAVYLAGLERNHFQTLNSDLYYLQLDSLKLAIDRKRPELTTEEMLFSINTIPCQNVYSDSPWTPRACLGSLMHPPYRSINFTRSSAVFGIGFGLTIMKL